MDVSSWRELAESIVPVAPLLTCHAMDGCRAHDAVGLVCAPQRRHIQILRVALHLCRGTHTHTPQKNTQGLRQATAAACSHARAHASTLFYLPPLLKHQLAFCSVLSHHLFCAVPPSNLLRKPPSLPTPLPAPPTPTPTHPHTPKHATNTRALPPTPCPVPPPRQPPAGRRPQWPCSHPGPGWAASHGQSHPAAQHAPGTRSCGARQQTHTCIISWYQKAPDCTASRYTAIQCTAIQRTAIQPTAMQRNQRVSHTHTPSTHKMGGLSLMSRRRMSASGVALIRSVTSEHLTHRKGAAARGGEGRRRGGGRSRGAAQRSTGSGDLAAP